MIDALLIKPGMHPQRIKVNTDTESLKAVIGNDFNIWFPFCDDVAIVSSPLDKMESKELNRGIAIDEKHFLVIGGDFLIVGSKAIIPLISSLTPKKLDEYEDMFYQPEAFTCSDVIMISAKRLQELLIWSAKNSAPENQKF